VEKLKPTEVTTGSAYAHDYQLPRGLSEALKELEATEALKEVLGRNFVDVYLAVKETEHDEFMRVISPWEREHLLMHV
jgi:glutamine synthetase